MKLRRESLRIKYTEASINSAVAMIAAIASKQIGYVGSCERMGPMSIVSVKSTVLLS